MVLFYIDGKERLEFVLIYLSDVQNVKKNVSSLDELEDKVTELLQFCFRGAKYQIE